MHRQIVYLSQVPLETDILNTNRNVLNGLGWLAQAVFGTSTLVTDVTCVQNSPAALNVLVTPGSILSLANVDATAYSSLAADTTHNILKQGLLVDNAVLAITPPGTVGFSQNYLIQATFQETDDTSTTLPYYNPSAPATAWNGPSGSGTPQFTRRADNMVVAAKAGVAATTGTQTTPSPDAGYVGLFVVTVANGQATITTGNITALVGAPVQAPNGKLSQVPTGVQVNSWLYAADTGAVNASVVQLNPAPAAYSTRLQLLFNPANTNTTTTPTVNLMGSGGALLGAKTIVRRDGTAVAASDLVAGNYYPLLYDGTSFRVQVYLASDLLGIGSYTSRYQVFLSNGTFTFPAAVTSVQVECIGGGGGAGASADGSSGSIAGNCGAGGGGGGYSRKNVTGQTPGSTQTVTVGAAGTGATSNASTGGGTSSFGAFCSATGGSAGSWGVITNGGSGSGGSGSGGDLNVTGTNGGFTGNNTAGTPTQSQIITVYNKGGGAAGGLSMVTLGGTGNVGVGYGSGGTGASGGSNVAGGNGAPGIVIVRW